MMHAMVRVYMLFGVLELLLLILALISCLSAEEGEVRALPRIVWVIVILLFPLAGSIVYFAVGRPETTTARRDVWRPGAGFPEGERPRTVAPDDDPEFLRKLKRQSDREDTELLRRWEEDLKRRENDLRNREDTPPADG
jgi:hypothetical protein